MEAKVIANIKSDFADKFGIPRQSGLVESLEALVVFQPEYRNADALRGLEEFTHIWLIWEFSEAHREVWSPTVRPPRLGGNTRLGVFATRSPFRPNAMGLSCVRLLGTEKTQAYGTVLRVAGADLMDGTPIFDIKPYIPYCDCRPEAGGGFTDTVPRTFLKVEFPQLELLPAEKRQAAVDILAEDPRPAYQADADRIYGLRFAGCEIHFRVAGEILTVIDVTPI